MVLLGANTLCGSAPEVNITVTTIYLDTDYVIDQVFWQYAAVLSDRLHAQQFAETMHLGSSPVFGAPLLGGRSPLLRTPLPRSDTASRMSFKTFWYAGC